MGNGLGDWGVFVRVGGGARRSCFAVWELEEDKGPLLFLDCTFNCFVFPPLGCWIPECGYESED